MERRGRRSPDHERERDHGDRRHGRRYDDEGFGSDRRDRRYDSGDDFDRGDRRFSHREEGRDFRRENVGRRGERGDGAAAAGQELPELYSILRGRVHSIKPFGLFVRLEGYRAHGLVHLSQVSNHEVTQREDSDEVKVQALAAIAGQGEEVWVKIISVRREEDGGVKIGCSMKLVGQTDGRDLDPNNLQADLNESRPARPARHKVTLDAVYNVSCSRCGGHGHLKSECYSTGDKTYELLPEEALDPVPPPPPAQPSAVVAEETLGKEEKNRHSASKSSKKRSYLPDSVTTVEEAKALIASLKDEKKKKKERKESKRHHSKHHKKRKEEESAH